jgi:hypothetical protein
MGAMFIAILFIVVVVLLLPLIGMPCSNPFWRYVAIVVIVHSLSGGVRMGSCTAIPREKLLAICP